MPCKKRLSPDQTVHGTISLPRPPEHPPGLITWLVNGVAFPSLCEGWEKAIVKVFDTLTDNELNFLRAVIIHYVVGRLIVTNPITWDDLISGLESTAQALESLIDGANEPAAVAIWQRILNELPPDRRKELDTVAGTFLGLSQAATAALQRARDEHAAGPDRAYDRPWIDLITALAGFCKSKTGTPPTAAKGLNEKNPKASPFVEFVSAVMWGAVPRDLREHVASRAAIAKAVSQVLSVMR